MIHKFPLSLGALCVAFAVHAYAEEQTTLDTITVNANASEVKANQIKNGVYCLKTVTQVKIVNGHIL